jgi:hypothetical protein
MQRGVPSSTLQGQGLSVSEEYLGGTCMVIANLLIAGGGDLRLGSQHFVPPALCPTSSSATLRSRVVRSPAKAAAMPAMPRPAPTSQTRRPRASSGCFVKSRPRAKAEGQHRHQYGSLSHRSANASSQSMLATTVMFIWQERWKIRRTPGWLCVAATFCEFLFAAHVLAVSVSVQAAGYLHRCKSPSRHHCF